MTRWSVTLVLPRTSISTTSFALSSSTALRTCWRRTSAGGGGLGRRVLMTCAAVVKGSWARWRRWDYTRRSRPAGVKPSASRVQASVKLRLADECGHRRRHPVLPARIFGGDAATQFGGRLRPLRAEAEFGEATGRQRMQLRGQAPARREFGVDRGCTRGQGGLVDGGAGAVDREHVAQFEQFAPAVPSVQFEHRIPA